MRACFAICKSEDSARIRRISLAPEVQEQFDGLFNAQEKSFRDSFDEEIEFTGDWKPDEDQILTVSIEPQTNPLEEAILANATAYMALSYKDLGAAGVKAIFSGYKVDDQIVIGIQKFSTRQLIERSRAYLYDATVFNKISEPLLILDDKIIAIIEGKKLKFKSFASVRGIFDLSGIYREATNEEVEKFANQSCMGIDHVQEFKDSLDQTSRRIIHSILKNETLDGRTASEIQKKAQLVNLDVTIENDKVKMPKSKKEMKRLLRFINDDMYKAPLSGERYVTNSKMRD